MSELPNRKEKEEDFFIPVQVMSRVFRGKFLDYMKKEKIEFYGSNKDLENAECVIQYLGRYTHRVAISNERILKIEGEKVTFKWRDYKDNNKMKEMIISIQEFIRRFLMHILPPHLNERVCNSLINKFKKVAKFE